MTIAKHQRDIRASIRAFLMLATREELELEKTDALAHGNLFRAECVQELIDEYEG
jgi:hypothetical protein